MSGDLRRTIGIDPGTARLGYAIVETERGNPRLLACGVVTTPKGMDMPQRLSSIYDELREIVRGHGPAAMAVEELFFAKNVTTAVSVGQARGIALLVAA